MMKNLFNKSVRVPFVLLLVYILVFLWSSYKTIDFSVWKVEAITSAMPVFILLVLYFKNIRLSNLAYTLASVLPIMHVIGAHYTFANVPFDWFNDLIGSDRNMYDRVAHASVGLYAFSIVEIFLSLKLVSRKWIAYTFAIFSIMALAALYELFEWWYAVSVNPEAGIEVLGSQGDIWDAQKDILMDTLGALFATIVFKLKDFINSK
jgi:putative membrane protein